MLLVEPLLSVVFVPTDSERQRFQNAYRSLQTVAVTGTNGKTSTTSMVEAIICASGEASARLTTMGAFVQGRALPQASSAKEFLQTVEAAVDAGVKTFALEVTSKALRKGWAQQWPAQVAVFTNLSRDHMDMHGSPEEYLACKAQLFMGVADQGTCVLNADDPSAALIAEVIPAHANIVYYSRDASKDSAVETTRPAGLAASQVLCTRQGLVIDLVSSPLADALGGCLSLSVLGDVHASNALAAAIACDAAGYSAAAILTGLRDFSGVPGRFQVVAPSPLCIVDYAHTPDGLKGTLRTARGLLAPGGKLHLVFGCGGERDRGKRPEMGALAHTMADKVIVTNDNPRREDPEQIASQIQAGAIGPGADWTRCLDRALAVATAVVTADSKDIVIVAGKGHEETQEIAGVCVAMSDVELVRTALEPL